MAASLEVGGGAGRPPPPGIRMGLEAPGLPARLLSPSVLLGPSQICLTCPWSVLVARTVLDRPQVPAGVGQEWLWTGRAPSGDPGATPFPPCPHSRLQQDLWFTLGKSRPAHRGCYTLCHSHRSLGPRGARVFGTRISQVQGSGSACVQPHRVLESCVRSLSWSLPVPSSVLTPACPLAGDRPMRKPSALQARLPFHLHPVSVPAPLCHLQYVCGGGLSSPLGWTAVSLSSSPPPCGHVTLGCLSLRSLHRVWRGARGRGVLQVWGPTVTAPGSLAQAVT